MDRRDIKKFKFVVIGGPNVGKTTLINSYINPGSIIETNPTVQLAYSNKEVTFEDRVYSLDICDTAGQERFQSICPNFYRGADGALIVFDVTNYASFQKVGDWIAEFLATMPVSFHTVIIGNKVDLVGSRAVSFDEALEYANSNVSMYFDVSAKNGDGVDLAFLYLIQKCIEESNVHEMTKHEEPETVNIGDLVSQNDNDQRKRSCC